MAGRHRVVELDEAAIASLTGTPEARELTEEAGREFADTARALAPRRTGAGAASIHGELVQTPDGVESDVSWDQGHHYMYFQELRTGFMARALGGTGVTYRVSRKGGKVQRGKSKRASLTYGTSQSYGKRHLPGRTIASAKTATYGESRHGTPNLYRVETVYDRAIGGTRRGIGRYNKRTGLFEY